MKVQELLAALAGADPTWDVDLEYRDYSGWESRPRFEERPLRSVHIDKYTGVTLSTEPTLEVPGA